MEFIETRRVHASTLVLRWTAWIARLVGIYPIRTSHDEALKALDTIA